MKFCIILIIALKLKFEKFAHVKSGPSVNFIFLVSSKLPYGAAYFEYKNSVLYRFKIF